MRLSEHLVVIAATDDFLAGLAQQKSLRMVSCIVNKVEEKHTCSNCAEYDPSTSISGA